MNVKSRTATLPVLAVFCAALLACAFTDKRRRAGVRGAPAALEALERAHAALPPYSSGIKHCDDPAIERTRDPKATAASIFGFDAEALGRAFKGVEPKSGDPWQWISPSETRYVAEARRDGRANGSVAVYIHEISLRGHVALFQAESRVAPSVADGKITPGRYVGAVFVMNLRTAGVACHAPFTAENTPDFAATQGTQGTELLKAAIKDLEQNFDRSLLEALRSISRSVEVTH
ncbi:MAG TPA: hypothetical protein PKA88_11035 [Polyangiaceae bacterium]|nr:hypothetical protein [Polyangiaceae bacterium]